MLTALPRHPMAAGLALIALACLVTALILIDLPAIWQKAVLFAVQMQRDLHKDLAAAMRALENAGPAAHWGLISLGFLYGLFHAIGPGHGKVVISTYLATHESRLGQGLLLSFLSSLMQGVTAIVLVGAMAFILERSLREAQGTGIALEVLSYGLVSLIGLFLMWRSGRNLLNWRRSSSKEPAAEHSGCCHHHHGPSATDLAATLSVRDTALMVLSVGIRPCSGAILVLILAFATGLVGAGIGAVMAMSIGTGLAVALLATFSVYARKSALTLAGVLSVTDRSLAMSLQTAAFIGGLLILIFGVTLLKASMVISKHPLL